MQLSWVAKAIEELGGTPPDTARAVANRRPARRAAAARSVLDEDVRDAQAFVDRWRPRVEAMSNARHRGMLRVILGETLEQKRFFEQALAGRTDLLGRRAEQLGPSHGEVLPIAVDRVSPAPPVAPWRAAISAIAGRISTFAVVPPAPTTSTNLKVSPVHRNRAGRRPRRSAGFPERRGRRRDDADARGSCSTRCWRSKRERGRERPFPVRRGRSIWI